MVTSFTTRLAASTNFGRGQIGLHGQTPEVKTLLDNYKTLLDEYAVAVNAIETALTEVDWLDSCRLAGVGNVNIASAPANFDGIAAAADDRILLLEQTDQKENGIYVFSAAAAAMTRATDFDTSAEVTSGAQVRVLLGAKHGGKAYYVNAADPITVGTTNITFARAGAPKANFAAVVAPGATDDLANGYEVGSLWHDTATNLTYICVDSTATAAVWSELSGIHVAAVIPTVTDDAAAGYAIGSRWYNTALARWYRCTDATATAAVWVLDGVIYAAAAPGATDDAADLIAVGQLWVDTAAHVVYSCVDATATAAIWREVSVTHSAAAIPTVTDDTDAGYSVASRWYNTALARWYRCTDASAGAAVWVIDAVIYSAAAPTANDDAGDLIAVGQLWVDTSAALPTAYVCLDATATAAIWREANDVHLAAAAPTANDDAGDGYRVGTLWIDTTTTPLFAYFCVDSTATAAVWREVNGIHVEAAAPTVTDDTDAGYYVGFKWVDTTATPPTEHICTDNSVGAAVWTEANGMHVAAADPTVAADDAAGYSVGSLWFATTSRILFYCYSNATGAAVWTEASGLHVAATIPLVTSDDAAGFYVGSRWYDTVLNREYICTDASTGAAVWEVVGEVVAATAPGVGDDDADWFVVGSTWFDTSTSITWRCLDASTGAAVWLDATIHVAATIPLVTSDDANGYRIGSRWYNTALGREYRCTDATTGAAVWEVVGTVVAAVAPVVGDDDADWFIVGSTWYNSATNLLYRAHDVSTGAAVWMVAGTALVTGSAPLVTSDLDAGFAAGFHWVDSSTGAIYVCVSAAVGTAVWVPIHGTLSRDTIAAESALAGDVIGATTETAHTAISIPSAILNTARRTVRFKALLHCVNDNGADTWTTKVRIGAAGVAGTEIYTTGAINNVAGDLWEVRGELYIATVGAGGTFHSVVHGELETGPADTAVYVTSGAIDTTVARELTVTGESSTNNAAQIMSLVHFEVEAMAA